MNGWIWMDMDVDGCECGYGRMCIHVWMDGYACMDGWMDG